MDRLEIIQSLITGKKLNNYLEIGVFNGRVLFRVKSTFKVAVDPAFRFDRMRRMGKLLINPYNVYNKYFSKTSDDFFSQDAPDIFSEKPIEIALIDGMHEYEFALRDIINSEKYLSDDGVIILHDCNPVTWEAAVRFADWEKRQFAGEWNGDVWKAILHIRSLRKDLTAFVLDADHGLGIIVKKPDDNLLSFTSTEIEALCYSDLEKNRQEWLGLQPASFFWNYFGVGDPGCGAAPSAMRQADHTGVRNK